MATDTSARSVGNSVDLLKSNERFYKQIEEPFSHYNNSKAEEAREIRNLLSSQQELATLSDYDLQEAINELESRIHDLELELNELLFSQDENNFERRMEIQLELKEKRSSLALLNSEFEVRRRVDAEINDIKETLKPENTPENMKRLSELEKSRDKRLAKARDAEFETLSQDVRNRYNDIRTALKNEIKDMARMQVEHILDLYRRGKNTNKEEIYQALNELLTKKLDNEELDDIIFNTVMPLVKKHSELFNIWNSYNELNQEKNEEPTTVEIPPEPHGTPRPEEELIEEKEEDKDKETGDEPQEVQPNVNAKWRTIASIAVGIGLGAGVWFAFGAAGVAALTIGGGIAKRLLAKKQAKLEMLREQGELKVHRAEDFPPTLKGQLQRFRSYINGPEGLDAIQKVLTASIITGVGFNILGPILGLEGGQVITALKGMGSTGTGSTSAGTGTVTNTVNNTNQTTTGLKAGDLRVGDSAGNLTTGYTDSYKALSGTDGVGLNQTFINNESSQIGSFLVRKGTESFTVTDPSLTVSEIATKFGVAETDIVANVVQNGTNIPQSWNSLSEIVNAKPHQTCTVPPFPGVCQTL